MTSPAQQHPDGTPLATTTSAAPAPAPAATTCLAGPSQPTTDMKYDQGTYMSSSSSSSDDESVDLDVSAISTHVPRPLGSRRTTVPSMACSQRLQQMIKGKSSLPSNYYGQDEIHQHHQHPHHHNHHHHHHQEEVSDPSFPRPPCSICGEKPSAYGLLQNCDHPFCTDCLRHWRQQGTTDDENELTSNFKCCPLCRTQSLLCVRSLDFVTGQAKREKIDQALLPKKSRPCRYFTKSLTSSRGPFCPFGDDCFYLHCMNDRVFRFGVGAEQMQKRLTARRRVAQHRSYPPSEDEEGSDNESNAAHPTHQPAPPLLFRRSGSIGRARTRFGGAGLGLTPMTPSPTTSRGSSPAPCPSTPEPLEPPSGEAGHGPAAETPEEARVRRRSSVAAAAAAARKARAARAYSLSSAIPQGKAPTNLPPFTHGPASGAASAPHSPVVRPQFGAPSIPTPGTTASSSAVPCSSPAPLSAHMLLPELDSPSLGAVQEDDQTLERAHPLPPSGSSR